MRESFGCIGALCCALVGCSGLHPSPHADFLWAAIDQECTATEGVGAQLATYEYLAAGYYDMALTSNDNEARTLASIGQVRHVLWLINHAPESAFLGEPAGTEFPGAVHAQLDAIALAWRLAVDAHPTNPLVLGHALASEALARGYDDYRAAWLQRLQEMRK
jgi:hypothetical protein